MLDFSVQFGHGCCCDFTLRCSVMLLQAFVTRDWYGKYVYELVKEECSCVICPQAVRSC